MADLITPNLVHPRTTLSAKILALRGQSFMKRTGPKMDKLSDDLRDGFLEDIETFDDENATVDTDAAGEFYLSLLAQLVGLISLPDVKPFGVAPTILFIPLKNSEYFVLVGDIASFDLQRFETLTEGTSAATLKLVFAADLTQGAARVVIGRQTGGGVVGAGDGIFTGGSSGGTLDTNATGGSITQRNPGVGGQLAVASTGLAHASQTSVSVAVVEAVGTKVTS